MDCSKSDPNFPRCCSASGGRNCCDFDDLECMDKYSDPDQTFRDDQHYWLDGYATQYLNFSGESMFRITMVLHTSDPLINGAIYQTWAQHFDEHTIGLDDNNEPIQDPQPESRRETYKYDDVVCSITHEEQF